MKNMRILCVILLGLVVSCSFPAIDGVVASDEFKVVTHNFLFQNSICEDDAFEAAAELILMGDVVGVQELNSVKARKLARMTGYNLVCPLSDWSSKIFTKHKIVEVGHLGLSVKLELPNGKQLWFVNVHLTPIPYGPYEINNITGIFGAQTFDPSSAEDRADIIARNKARRLEGSTGRNLLKAIEKASADNLTIIVTGDFNEPSHLDWVQASVDAGYFPAVMPWPVSVKMAELGFKDSFREIFPDPAAVPGFTWSPFEKYQTNTNAAGETIPEPFDRIDFIYYNGSSVTPADSQIIGPVGDAGSDIHIEKFSSDHRAVITTFDLN
ncbi:MAG: endonuclease/exonuclease/phosphatase family protein [Spirochaetales bacterium]|nr:endonuclease/exonuclease/phosphatase family protein [Spirochaetales bacterium]